MLYLVVKCDFCPQLHIFTSKQIRSSLFQETIIIDKMVEDDASVYMDLPEGWSCGGKPFAKMDSVRCPAHTYEYNLRNRDKVI